MNKYNKQYKKQKKNLFQMKNKYRMKFINDKNKILKTIFIVKLKILIKNQKIS